MPHSPYECRGYHQDTSDTGLGSPTEQEKHLLVLLHTQQNTNKDKLRIILTESSQF